LFDEFLPNFNSNQFNVRFDETEDLGRGRSKDLVAKVRVGRGHLEFLFQNHRNLKSSGITMQSWGYFIMDLPGLMPELLREVIAKK